MTEGCNLHPIGYVKSPVKEPTDEGWGRIISRIEVLPPYRPGLVGLDQFSHVMVVSFMHQAAFDPERHLVRRPRGLASMPEVGIFAQRAKDRPNPIGITAVRLVAVAEDAATVQGLDAIDGTPVLDLKPYYRAYDFVPEASVPEWVDRLMAGYFEPDRSWLFCVAIAGCATPRSGNHRFSHRTKTHIPVSHETRPERSSGSPAC